MGGRAVRVVVVLLVGTTVACAPGGVPPGRSGERESAVSEPVRAPHAAAPRPAPTLPRPAEAAARPTPPATVSASTDPDTLATALVAAERAIRDPATPADHLAGWAWSQQQAYRDLAAMPAWQEPVRAQVPQDLLPAFDANLRATTELRALTTPRTELPDWRIVAPPPADQLLDLYRAAEAEFGVDWEVLAGIHLVETRMGRIRGVSVAGARGPMQFLPSTWARYGEGDIEDPHDAIRAAARYLVAHGAHGDLDGALYAYNPSRRYVAAISAYAEVMRSDERAYLGYYHWRVYYRTVDGDVLLDEGYGT